MTSLRDEIKQRKPFGSVQHEAVLNILRTSNLLTDTFERVIKPHGITGSQYNVLRILRGAAPGGLCRNDIRERLLNRMPDVTRLLDRMEQAGLVSRSRDGDDRRIVTTKITRAGMRIVNVLDEPVAKQHQQQLGHMSDEQLRTLVRLLTVARNSS
ncbi:MAG TPA: MarR family transcriptional regulator [Gemmatimonadaceae bacterium]|nr:MarR family transcriptional regulator [Gemmatimonadaceae bacterium]